MGNEDQKTKDKWWWLIIERERNKGPFLNLKSTLACFIFLRWADFKDSGQEAIASSEDLDFVPVLNPDLHWSAWHKLPLEQLKPFLVDRLIPALANLDDSNDVSLSTQLHHTAIALENVTEVPMVNLISNVKQLSNVNVLSAESLADMVNWLADQPFDNDEHRLNLLEKFDALRGDFFENDYYLPKSISYLMAEIANTRSGKEQFKEISHVYNPCLGFGKLLTDFFDSYSRHCMIGLPTRTDSAIIKFKPINPKSIEFSGVEKNIHGYVIGLVRLVLSGIDNPKIHLGNALELPPYNDPYFDLVLANPPLGGREKSLPLDHFPIPTKNTEELFVQHALSNLCFGGRAILLLGDGFMFRSGSTKDVRKMLVENNTVEAIISLPPNSYLPFNIIAKNILVVRRGGSTKKIRMIDTGPLFERIIGSKTPTISDRAIRSITKDLWSSEPSRNAWDVDVKELKAVDYDLTPKRRDSSSLNGMLKVIEDKIEIAKLGDLCEVLSGHQIKLSDLLENNDSNTMVQSIIPHDNALKGSDDFLINQEVNDEVLFYIRIKDLNEDFDPRTPFIPSKYISEEATPSIKEEWKLRDLDVLISKSGTIGKTGIMINRFLKETTGGSGGVVQCVASGGFFVLRVKSQKLDPKYLLAYLRSKDVCSWLKDRARGTAIQHITRSVLSELAIPLPPLETQHLVTKDSWCGGDSLRFLVKKFFSEYKLESDPVSEKLSEVITHSKPALIDNDFKDPLDFSEFEKLAKTLLRLVADMKKDENDPVYTWMTSYSRIMQMFQGITNIPFGPSLYSLLVGMLNESEYAEIQMGQDQDVQWTGDGYEGWSENSERARELGWDFQSRLYSAINDLTSNVALTFTPKTNRLSIGKMIECEVVIRNQGKLPLRNLFVTTNPNLGETNVPYLSENGEYRITLKGESPKILGAANISLSWKTLRMDNIEARGSQEIPFEIVETGTTIPQKLQKLGSNPYVIGNPILPNQSKNLFFGRENLMESISRQIIKSGNVILLEGNRRSGKTSILRHLEGSLSIPNWLNIYCSLQDIESKETKYGLRTEEIFRGMAGKIANGLFEHEIECPLPDGTILPLEKKLGKWATIDKACCKGIDQKNSFASFRDYLEIILDILEQKSLGLLLMIDEFDKIQEGIDNKITSPQIPENIRFLIHEYPSFSAVLTGSRSMTRLREQYWSALFGLGTPFNVSSLQKDAAERLVIEPAKNQITYSKEAVAKICFLTSMQPYLLQLLCNSIFELAAEFKTASITLDIVEKAAYKLVKMPGHFGVLWNDHTETDRRRLLLHLLQKGTKSKKTLTLGRLTEELLKNGIGVSDTAVIDDLDFLCQLELVKPVSKDDDREYVLAIPLMGIWIDQQQDFAKLRAMAINETEDQNE
jgi:type I restriction enzyme M protein